MTPWLLTGACTSIIAALLFLGHRRAPRDPMAFINAQRLARHVHGPFKQL